MSSAHPHPKRLISLVLAALLAVSPVVALAATVVAQQEPGASPHPDLARPEIEYAYPDQSVWTARVDTQGNPDNPLLKVASALFARAGVLWHGKSLPAARLFMQLQEGRSQFAMLVKAPTLDRCCLFSQHPIARTELRVYRYKDKPPIKTISDLAGKSVITIRGYSYSKILDFITDGHNAITNSSASTHELSFLMLKSGRGDYLLDYAGPAREVLTDHPIPDLDFDVLAQLEVYLILSRNYPDAATVMSRLEEIAATLNVTEILATVTP
ncbi:Amino acid ABC transporter [uncultured Gammaproteobacteria bacterium]